MGISAPGSDPTRPGRLPRGMSMDMLGSPYLLPAGLQGSRESIHSMSRSIQDEHDPYRPVTFMRDSGEASRYPRLTETGSVYSATSTIRTGNEKSNLLTNASTMSHSFPKRGDSMTASEPKSPEESQPRDMHSANRSMASSRKTSLSSAPTLPYISETPPPRKDSRKESLPPVPPPQPQPEPYEETVPRPTKSSFSTPRPPRKESMSTLAPPVVERPISDTSFYGDEIPPPPPPKMMDPQDWSEYEPEPAVMYAGRFSIDTPAPSQQYPIQDNRLSVMQNNRLSVMGLRPLPPDHPEENPEQRANRIRSFYKEYFDVNRPNPAGYYEDWDANYMDASFQEPPPMPDYYPQAQFAQPMGRRAMTPPPRGASRFPGGEHGRHFSTMSGGGPSPFRGRPTQRPPPKKKLPPPKALTSLPTPHLLSTDSAIMNAADFAPPTSFREMQNGRRPDSPLGTPRPYSPSVKAFSPLVPAHGELNVMPSPHQLRKSGTFTSLDFAALPRFRGQEGAASDSGSIRSARSGMSAMQLDAVRAGAYRVSRIPKEFVTSREDLSTQLRPKWDLVSPA